MSEHQTEHVSEAEAREVLDRLNLVKGGATTRDLADALDRPEHEIVQVVNQIRSEKETAAHYYRPSSQAKKVVPIVLLVAGLGFLMILLLFFSTARSSSVAPPAEPVIETTRTVPAPEAPLPTGSETLPDSNGP
jgi:hypothetical protein